MSILENLANKVGPISYARKVIGLVIFGIVLSTELGLTWYVNGLQKQIKNKDATITQLSSDKALLEQNIKVVKENNSALVKINEINLLTIEAFKKERAESMAAIDSLKKNEQITKKKIKDLAEMIDKLKGDPVKDAPLAPVLKDTISNIQNMENQQ